MSRIDDLIRHYEHFVALPWSEHLSGSQKVWFVVYNKMDERQLRTKIGEFELATRQADHGWQLIDLTHVFGRWMADHELREGYFEEPEYLNATALEPFRDAICSQIRTALQSPLHDEQSILAIQGVACLFGLVRVSEIINQVEADIKGRLLVLFPGEHTDNSYSLLDARDGWNYHAVPIKAHS